MNSIRIENRRETQQSLDRLLGEITAINPSLPPNPSQEARVHALYHAATNCKGAYQEGNDEGDYQSEQPIPGSGNVRVGNIEHNEIDVLLQVTTVPQGKDLSHTEIIALGKQQAFTEKVRVAKAFVKDLQSQSFERQFTVLSDVISEPVFAEQLPQGYQGTLEETAQKVSQAVAEQQEKAMAHSDRLLERDARLAQRKEEGRAARLNKQEEQAKAIKNEEANTRALEIQQRTLKALGGAADELSSRSSSEAGITGDREKL